MLLGLNKLDHGPWTMDHNVDDPWSMVHGPWSFKTISFPAA